ncbi:MAG: type IV secretion protein Rhs [Nitrospirae bacterium]|nr:MAG: type IV secretion protein Rhs [Nitrospirota bacterium]
MDQTFATPTPGLWLGSYLAEVVDLRDPEGQARVQVRLLNCDGVDDQNAPIWARMAVPLAGRNRGTFWIPDVGDEVLVTFVNGDARWPIIVGGLWNGRDMPPESMDSGGRNELKVFRSRNGVTLTLDDHDGQERLALETPGGQQLTLKDGPGSIEIRDSNGNAVTLEPDGITITAAAKVTVNASQVDIAAGMVTVSAGMSQFSGVVQCQTLITNAVVSSSYTPGAGNVW